MNRNNKVINFLKSKKNQKHLEGVDTLEERNIINKM